MRFLLTAVFLLGADCAGAFEGIKLTDEQALAVGKKIWLKDVAGLSEETTTGVHRAKLTKAQADYLGIAPQGPFKPETYRY